MNAPQLPAFDLRATTRAERLWLCLLALVTLGAVVLGWQIFLFFTDAAYASFRYISNARAGWGLTWNPPPFPHVEGYGSFLWLTLLRGIWWLTGLEPPAVANPLSLILGLCSLVLVARCMLRTQLPLAHRSSRLALLAVVLLGIVTNRTFLTWLSSGLETALFNLLVIAWALEALAPTASRGRWWLLRLATLSALLALTRVDGQAEVRATALIALLLFLGGFLRAVDLAQLLPLGAVVVHLLWRHAFYGGWISNLRLAEYTSPWPQAGLRYTASFVLEYGVWIWVVLVIAWLIQLSWSTVESPPRAWRSAVLLDHGPRSIAVAALAWPVVFCTFLSGGDHFEYRTYSYLVPLLFLSAAWLAVHISETASTARGLVMAFVLASWPIPWTHFEFSHYRWGRGDTFKMVVPVAPVLPVPLNLLAMPWDDLQAWLIPHMVCMRHQEHKVFFATEEASFPSRAEGSKVAWDAERPVMTQPNAGVAGWVMPNVALIDDFGMHDPVIARSALDNEHAEVREMDHEHAPPPGYLECYRPNVTATPTQVTVTPRKVPLTDADILRCQAHAWN